MKVFMVNEEPSSSHRLYGAEKKWRGQPPSLLPPSCGQKGAEHRVPLQGADWHTPSPIPAPGHCPCLSEDVEWVKLLGHW